MDAAPSVVDRPLSSPPVASGLPRLREHRFDDADAQAELLDGLDQRYQQLTAGRFAGVLHECALDGIDVFRERLGQGLHQTGVARPGHWTFATAVALQGPAVWNGSSVPAETVICFTPAREFELRTPRVSECVGFSVTDAALSAFLDTHGEPDPAHWHGARAVTTQDPLRRAPLLALLEDALDAMARDPAAFADPAPQRALRESLLERVCEAADADDAQRLACAPPSAARLAQVVQRARAWAEAHLDAPVTVGDLCRAANCSRRTLQYAFERVLDVNPVAWVRAVRLNGARRDLKLASPGTTVADIATRWGFWHLPRFAGAYAQMFGELPSATLRAHSPRHA
jgi:AraC family ethanolamine operon transcriptional activator